MHEEELFSKEFLNKIVACMRTPENVELSHLDTSRDTLHNMTTTGVQICFGLSSLQDYKLSFIYMRRVIFNHTQITISIESQENKA